MYQSYTLAHCNLLSFRIFNKIIYIKENILLQKKPFYIYISRESLEDIYKYNIVSHGNICYQIVLFCKMAKTP